LTFPNLLAEILILHRRLWHFFAKYVVFVA